jgi:peptidoglycan/xylan/chitin deacetylase (PgdA/CDA1 family)
MLIAANYHYIRPDFNYKYPGIYGLTPKQFEDQLVKLSGIGEFVSSNDILAALDNEKQLPDRAILITFDDGLKEQYDLALPVLDKLGIPAILYINTQNVAERKVSLVHKIHLLLTNMPYDDYQREILEQAGKLFEKNLDLVDTEKAISHYNYDTPDKAVIKAFLNFVLTFEEQGEIIGKLFEMVFPGQEEKICDTLYLDKTQIMDLQNRGYLGSHSHRHIPLGLYSEADMEKDIQTSYNIIRDITGQAPQAISYPYGSLEASSATVQAIAEKTGFRFGFTMERAGNTDFTNPLGLARFDCNDVPGGKSELFDGKSFFDRIPVSSWFQYKQQAV